MQREAKTGVMLSQARSAWGHQELRQEGPSPRASRFQADFRFWPPQFQENSFLLFSSIQSVGLCSGGPRTLRRYVEPPAWGRSPQREEVGCVRVRRLGNLGGPVQNGERQPQDKKRTTWCC